jgi:WD40 repeat protein
MVIFTNQNILKLILSSFNLKHANQLSEERIHNKMLFKLILLNLISYKSLFKSLGKTKIFFEAHDVNINSIAKLPDGNIISASNDKTLKIWNVKTFQCIKTLEGHTDSVSSVLVHSNENIISCSKNNELKFWNLEYSFKCIKTLYLDSKRYLGIIKLTCLVNGNLACSTFEHNNDNYYIIIFDKSIGYKCLKQLEDHTAWISSIVNLAGGLFATGSYDQTVRVWDIKEDYKCIKTLNYSEKAPAKEVNALLYCEKERVLLSAYRNHNIKAWNVSDNFQCVRTITCQHSGIKNLLYLPGGLFAVNTSNSITLFNLSNFECINTVECQDDENTELVLLDDNRIASFSLNNIILWG